MAKGLPPPTPREFVEIRDENALQDNVVQVASDSAPIANSVKVLDVLGCLFGHDLNSLVMRADAQHELETSGDVIRYTLMVLRRPVFANRRAYET